MRRLLAVLAGAITGATAAVVVLRRRAAPAPLAPPAPDPRAEDLRRKLAEAREAAAEEDDFEAAGMGPETAVEEEPPRAPGPADPKSPGDEFEAMRRRVHEEARTAAEEMRKEPEPDEPA